MIFRVAIIGPGNNESVGRSISVGGACTDREAGVIAATIVVQFGVGGPSVAADVDINSGDWSCVGSPSASIRGADTFVITAIGNAVFTRIPGQIGPNPTGSGSDSVTVRMADINPPQLAINTVPQLAGNATTAVDWTPTQLPADFRLAGSLVEGDARISTVQCAIDTGPFQTVTSTSGSWATWELHASLAAGYHRFVVRATDVGGLSTTLERWIKVHANPDAVDAHTASVTSWTRLEPKCRTVDMGRTVSARIFDPLWMMTRQWQVGEFQGEDTGSPISARVRATSGSITRYTLGQLPTVVTPGQSYDPLRAPLESIVERRRMRPADVTEQRMLSLAVDAGLHFLHMLDQAGLTKSYRAALIAKFALPQLPSPLPYAADDATQRFEQTMAGRAPDARQLATAFRSGGSLNFILDPTLKIALADQLEVKATADAWLAWYESMFSEPATPADDAWNPARLEYSVSVAGALSAQAPDEVTLTATELDDGLLDWSNFDVNAGVKLGSAGDRAAASLVETTIPAPVTFRGMPAVRFWELEDSKIAYGLMSVGKTDLAHLMMIEFASSYGNDWFVVPLTVPVGSLTRVDSLVVTDTFGVQRLIRPIGASGLQAAGFSMWQHAALHRAGDPATTPVPNLFFLPPSLARVEEGTALEDVLFMRDEMANMAWAIERTVESSIEQPSARAYDSAPPPSAQALSGTGIPRYVLASAVPENWIPLVPVQIQHTGAPTELRLQRAALLQPDGSANKINQAHSETLMALTPLRICDEEVPREGARLTRSRRLSRWVDGSFWVWTAFRRRAGNGEGSSGLQYDQLVPQNPTQP
jgi:hypothetical protein